MVADSKNLEDLLARYHVETGMSVEVISFRDTILPELTRAVSTANYDDEVLRTFSLIKQWKEQESRLPPTAQSAIGKLPLRNEPT